VTVDRADVKGMFYQDLEDDDLVTELAEDLRPQSLGLFGALRAMLRGAISQLHMYYALGTDQVLLLRLGISSMLRKEPVTIR
jgi:hypothetical protein